jgi:hypothetical protein
MDFEISGKKIAGGTSAILAEDDVREVFSLFGDKCLEVYKIDVRDKKTFMSVQILRQVRSFVHEFGVEDSKGIIERLFELPYNGTYNGKTIGPSIFSRGYRWLANSLLMEKAQQDKYGNDMSWSKW